MAPQLHITQHKRFVPYGTHPKPSPLCILLEGRRYYKVHLARFYNENKLYGLEGWASFMLGTLSAMFRR